MRFAGGAGRLSRAYANPNPRSRVASARCTQALLPEEGSYCTASVGPLRLARIVTAPEVRERMQHQGVNMKAAGPEEFSKLVQTDIATLNKVVSAAGNRIQ